MEDRYTFSTPLAATVAAILDHQTGLAVFVKTPGLSPIKTRLAADIGAPAAAAVYEESLAATTALLQAAAARYPALGIYWAVGEAAAVTNRRWLAFPAVWTGRGGLGTRLHRIYHSLRKRHRRVILIGSDCPQLTLAELEAAATTDTLTIGPASDGGFYLFAADWSIPRRCWQAVEYSRADTTQQLLAQFPDRQPLMLPAYTDIDDLPSLNRAVAEWRRQDATAAARLARHAAAL